jgi:hypothetical protein
MYLDVKINAKESTVSEHSVDSFGAKGTLEVGDSSYDMFRLSAVGGSERLPFSLKVLLENLLRERGRRKHHRRPDPCPGRMGPERRA